MSTGSGSAIASHLASSLTRIIPMVMGLYLGGCIMPLLIDRHGILRSAKCARGREGNRTTCWFPLAAEERIADRRLFLRHLQRPITLQAGVTITTVMDALAPW